MKIQELCLNVLLVGFLSNAISGQNAWNRPMKVEHRSGAWDFKGLKGHGAQDIHSWRPDDSQVKTTENQQTQQSKIDIWGSEDSQSQDNRNVNFPKNAHGEIGLTSPQIIVTGWNQLQDVSAIAKDIGVSGFNKLHSDGIPATLFDNGEHGFNQFHADSASQTHSEGNQQNNEGWVSDENRHDNDERWKTDENQNRNEDWARDTQKQNSDINWKDNANQNRNEGWEKNEHKQQPGDNSWKANTNLQQNDHWSRDEHKQDSADSWKAKVNQQDDESWAKDEHKQQGDERWRADVNQHRDEGWTGHEHHDKDNWKANVNEQSKEGWTSGEKQHIDESLKIEPNLNGEHNEGWSKEHKQHSDGSWKSDKHPQKIEVGLVSDENPHQNYRSEVSAEKKLNSGIGWTPEANQQISVDNWAPEANKLTHNHGWTSLEKHDIPINAWTPEENHPTANSDWPPQEQQKIPADYWTPEVNKPKSDNDWPSQEKQNIPADNWNPEVNNPTSNNGWISQEKQNIPVNNLKPDVNHPISNNGWTSQEKQNIPVDNWTPKVNQPASNNGWIPQQKHQISDDGWTSGENQKPTPGSWIPDDNVAKNWNENNKDDDKWIEEGNRGQHAPGISGQWNNEFNKINNDGFPVVHHDTNLNNNLPKGDIVPTESPFVNRRPQGNYKGGDGTYYESGGNGEISYTSTIPGTAGVDYPNYTEIPLTGFDCKNQQFPGYFADIEARCQVYHVCQSDGRHNTFLCPTGTIFNQKLFTCDWWYNYDCSSSTEHYSLNQMLYREGDAQGNYKGSHYPGPARQNFIAGDILESVRQDRGLEQGWTNNGESREPNHDHNQQDRGWSNNGQTRINTDHNRGPNQQDQGWTNNDNSGINIIHNDGQNQGWTKNEQNRINIGHNHGLDQGWTNTGQTNLNSEHNQGQNQHDLGWTNNEQIRINTAFNPGQDEGWNNNEQPRINSELRKDRGWTNRDHTRVNTEHGYGQDQGWTNEEQTEQNHVKDQGFTKREQIGKNTGQNYRHNEGWTNSEQTSQNAGLGWPGSSHTGANLRTDHEVIAYDNINEKRKDEDYGPADDNLWNIKRIDTELWGKDTDEGNYQPQAIGGKEFNENSKVSIEDTSPITESNIAISQDWQAQERASVDGDIRWITSPEYIQTSVAAQDRDLDTILQDDRSNFAGRTEANNEWITNLEHDDQTSAAKQDLNIDSIVQDDRSKFDERHKEVSKNNVEYSKIPLHSDEARYSDMEKQVEESNEDESFGPNSNDFSYERGISDKTNVNRIGISQLDTAAIGSPVSHGEESLGYGVSGHMSSVLEGVRDESTGHESRKSSIEASTTSAIKPERQKMLGTKKEINSEVGRTGKENTGHKSASPSVASESEIEPLEGTEKPISQNKMSAASRITGDILEPVAAASDVFESKLQNNSRFKTQDRVNAMAGKNRESITAQESKLSRMLVLASDKLESNRKSEIKSQYKDNVKVGKNIGIYSAGDSSEPENRLPIVPQEESLIPQQNDFDFNTEEGSIRISGKVKWDVNEENGKKQRSRGLNQKLSMNPQVSNINRHLNHDHKHLHHDLVNLHQNQKHVDDIHEHKTEEGLAMKENEDVFRSELAIGHKNISESTKDNSKFKIYDDGKGQQPVMAYILRNRENNQLKVPGLRMISNSSDDLNINTNNYPMYNFRVTDGNRNNFFQALNSEDPVGISSGDDIVEDGDFIRGRKATLTFDASEDKNINGRNPKFNFKVVKVRRNKSFQTSNSGVVRGDSSSQVDGTAEVDILNRRSKSSSIFPAREDANANKSRRVKFVFKVPSGNINKYYQSQPVVGASGTRANFDFSKRTSESLPH